MSKIKLALIYFLTIFLDIVVLPRVNIFGISPMIGLVVIVVLSFRAKSEKITYFAIIFGLLIDIYFSSVLGLRALSYYLISYYTFKFRRSEGNNFTNALPSLIIATGLNSLFLSLVKIIINDKSRKTLLNLSLIIKNAFLEIIVSIILYVFVYLFIEKVIFKAKKEFFS